MTPERFYHLQYKIFSLTTEIDRKVGQLIDELEKMNMMDNTYIILMSDNGLFQGEHGLMSKGLHYEESVRVPLFIVGPGITPGFDDQSLATNLDIAPTLLDLAGIPIPENMHGMSLKKTLMDKTPFSRSYAMLEHPDENTTLEVRPAYSLRSRQWKYIQTFENGNDEPFTFEELYNLNNDPFEMENLAGDPAYRQLINDLREELKSTISQLAP